ncbi:MAG: hypothetical protein R3D33_08885 [Hyphomicrobiaceae bacterium]
MRRGPLAGLGAAVLAGLALLSATASADDGPFSGYAGRWVGNGSIKMASGASEPIKCRVTYFISNGGATLQQNIRCASDSYAFEVKSNVQAAGGSLSGTWEETTRSVVGDLSGSLKGRNIRLSVSAPNFSASMSVEMSGSGQSVVISPKGIDVTRVSIGLRRG